jgi:putative endonuclease
MYYAYILISGKSNRFYVGHSNDLGERLKTHNLGKVKSTRNKGPWKCVYFEEFSTKLEANRRELQIKKQKSKKYIEDLINNMRK